MGKMSEQLNLMDPGFAQAFQEHLTKMAQATGIPVMQAKQILSTILFGQMNQQAAVMGINDAYFWTMGFAVVGFVLSMFLRDVRKDHLKKGTSKQTITTLEAEKMNPEKEMAAG
jgi:DHA2 family multidrug resistance protein